MEENGVCEDYSVSGVDTVVISCCLHRDVGQLPQMQHSFWEAGREQGCVPVNLEVGTQREENIQ